MIFSFYQFLSDASFLAFLISLIAVTLDDNLRLGIPAEINTALVQIRDVYKEAYLAIFENPNAGSVDIARKDAARAVGRHKSRPAACHPCARCVKMLPLPVDIRIV